MIAPESFATGEQNHAASCQGIPCARESGILKSGIRRQIFLPSRARLTSRCPPAPHARNLENPVVPTLLARGSRHAFLVQCVDGVAGPAACGNKILTIFAPYTLSHNQGQTRTKTRTCPSLPDDSFTPLADEKINQIKTVVVC